MQYFILNALSYHIVLLPGDAYA